MRKISTLIIYRDFPLDVWFLSGVIQVKYDKFSIEMMSTAGLLLFYYATIISNTVLWWIKLRNDFSVMALHLYMVLLVVVLIWLLLFYYATSIRNIR